MARPLCLAVLILGHACLAFATATPSWTTDPILRAQASARIPAPSSSMATAFPAYTVSLDDAPADRWAHIASLPYFRTRVLAALDYIASQVPAWLLPTLEVVLGDVDGYFGDELGGEMRGLAQAFGSPVKLGDVVAFNLIMQLESIGINCSNWNVTAPTTPDDPGCKDVDPDQAWCYCHNASNPRILSKASLRASLGLPELPLRPGLCTSVVAQDAQQRIFHGRNLDWNIPAKVREMAADITFQRGGKTAFMGTTVVGFVGVFNGMRPGKFTISLNARGKGGKLIVNILQMLKHKSKTPAQHLRAVLQNTTGVADFRGAVDALSTGEQVDENYFIVGGVAAGEGAVISRARDKADDVWYIGRGANQSSGDTAQTWYRLQTNYDHWQPPPKADDRRAPGYANMDALLPAGVGLDGSGLLKRVMEQWPTKNMHTDYTAVMSAAAGVYHSMVWMDPAEEHQYQA